MIYNILRALFWGLTRLVCRYRVIGLERVPSSGTLLIVANHLSFYDPMLLGVILPRRAWFFTKAEIFRWPIAEQPASSPARFQSVAARATAQPSKKG